MRVCLCVGLVNEDHLPKIIIQFQIGLENYFIPKVRAF